MHAQEILDTSRKFFITAGFFDGVITPLGIPTVYRLHTVNKRTQQEGVHEDTLLNILNLYNINTASKVTLNTKFRSSLSLEIDDVDGERYKRTIQYSYGTAWNTIQNTIEVKTPQNLTECFFPLTDISTSEKNIFLGYLNQYLLRHYEMEFILNNNTEQGIDQNNRVVYLTVQGREGFINLLRCKGVTLYCSESGRLALDIRRSGKEANEGYLGEYIGKQKYSGLIRLNIYLK